MSGTSDVLKLGLDSSGVKTGGDQAKVTLAQLKEAADKAAAALDNVTPSSTRTGRSLSDLKAQAAQAGDGMKSMGAGTEALAGAFGLASRAAAGLGAAWVAMRLSDAIRDMTLAAARIETLGVVLARVSEQTRFSSREVTGFVGGVQSMGITSVAARQGVLQLVQAQIDLSNASKLARVAQDAAVIANTNSSEAYDRLITGIASGQVDILRTLGLNADFARGQELLAESLHKSTAALSAQEKVQANVNEGLRAGAVITGSYEAGQQTAGKQLQSLTRYFQDAAAIIGTAFLPAFSSLITQVTAGMKAITEALAADAALGRAGWLGTIGAALKWLADNIVPIAGVIATAFAAIFGGPVLAGATALAAAIAYFGLTSSQASRDSKILSDALDTQKTAIEAGTEATIKRVAAEKLLKEQQDATAASAAAARLAEVQAAAGRATNRLSLDGAVPSALMTGPNSEAIQLLQAKQAFGKSDQGAEALQTLTDKFIELDRAMGDDKAWIAWTAGFAGMRQEAIQATAAVAAMAKTQQAATAQANRPGYVSANLPELASGLKTNLSTLGLGVDSAGASVASGQLKALEATAALKSYQDQLTAGLAAANRAMQEQVQGSNAWNRAFADAEAIVAQMAKNALVLPEAFRVAGEAAKSGFEKAQEAAARAALLATMLNPNARAVAQGGFAGIDAARAPGFDEETRRRLGISGEVSDAQRAQAQRAIAGENAAASLAGDAAQRQQATREAEIRAQFAYKIAIAETDGAEAVGRARREMDLALEASRGQVNAAAAAARSYEEMAAAIGKAQASLSEMNRDLANQAKLAEATARGPGAQAAEERAQEAARLRRLFGPAAGVAGASGAPTAALAAGASGGPFAAAFAASAAANNLPPGLLPAVAMRESSMNPNTPDSPTGARGLMQILPSTAARPGYGVTPVADPMNPEAAIAFAGQYIGALRDTFGGLAQAIDRYSGHGYSLGSLGGAGASTGGAVSSLPAIPGITDAQLQATAAAKVFAPTDTRLAGQVAGTVDAEQSARNQLAATFQNDQAREHSLALGQLAIQQEHDLANAANETQTATVNARYAELRASEDVLDGLRQQQEAAKTLREFSVGAADALSTGLESVIIKGGTAKEAIAGIAMELERMLWRVAVTKPLENALSIGLGGLFGAASGGGGFVDTTSTFAQGGVFPGGISAKSGEIFDRPTLFTFAKGGIMGEGGSPEAVMGLVRGSDGNLGVRASGGVGSNLTVNSTVNVTTTPGGQVPSGKDLAELQRQLDASLEASVRKVLVAEKRPGGLAY